MKTEINEKEVENMLGKIKEKDLKKADWWYPRIQANPKKIKELREKAKNEEQYEKILFIIEQGLTLEDVMSKRRNSNVAYIKKRSEQKTKTNLIDVLPKDQRSIFDRVKGPLSDILAERDRILFEQQKEIEDKQKRETEAKKREEEKNRREAEENKKKQEKMKKEEEVKKMKEKEVVMKKAEQKKLAIAKYQRLKQLAGIESDVEMDKLGHPIIPVTWREGKAQINDAMVFTGNSHKGYMWQKVWNPSMRRDITVPMKIVDKLGRRLFVEPCTEKIDDMIKKEKEKRQKQMENKAIDITVITFNGDIDVTSEKIRKRISVPKEFKERVIKNPDRHEGLYKAEMKSEGEDYVFVIPFKRIKTLTESETEELKVMRYGVHKPRFPCRVYVSGNQVTVIPISIMIEGERLRVPREKLEELKEGGDGNVWLMEYRGKYRDSENFSASPVENLGDANEYIKNMMDNGD